MPADIRKTVAFPKDFRHDPPMTDSLRIIQVVNVRWFNATAWYGLFLSRLLRDAGYEVLVLGLEGTESFARAQAMGLEPAALDLNGASPVRLARTLRRLNRLIHEFSPHLVNCHRGEGFILWDLLRSLSRDFALVRTRGDQRPPKGNLPNHLLHRRADALIATNSRTARALAGTLDLPADRIHTVLGGVDESVFFPDPQGRERVREELGYAGEDFVVGLLGRFDLVKGQIELLEALAGLRAWTHCSHEPFYRLHLLFMGFSTSLEQSEVEDAIRRLHLEDRVRITGRRDDIPACINACDLGVVASQGSEAIARAAFEIMACGVPLVGTDVGVMPDLLAPEALVPPGKPAALRALLGRAVLDEEFRRRLATRQGVQIAGLQRRHFLENTLAVYSEALSRRGLPRPHQL